MRKKRSPPLLLPGRFLAITLGAEIVIALGILGAAPIAHAPMLDLDSCHDDLDRLRRAASDASDEAEDADSKRTDFQNCRRDPDIYDLGSWPSSRD